MIRGTNQSGLARNDTNEAIWRRTGKYVRHGLAAKRLGLGIVRRHAISDSQVPNGASINLGVAHHAFILDHGPDPPAQFPQITRFARQRLHGRDGEVRPIAFLTIGDDPEAPPRQGEQFAGFGLRLLHEAQGMDQKKGWLLPFGHELQSDYRFTAGRWCHDDAPVPPDDLGHGRRLIIAGRSSKAKRYRACDKPFIPHHRPRQQSQGVWKQATGEQEPLTAIQESEILDRALLPRSQTSDPLEGGELLQHRQRLPRIIHDQMLPQRQQGHGLVWGMAYPPRCGLDSHDIVRDESP